MMVGLTANLIKRLVHRRQKNIPKRASGIRGRRSISVFSEFRGRAVGYRKPRGKITGNVAILHSILEACRNSLKRTNAYSCERSLKINVTYSDLLVKVKKYRAPITMMLIVDSSSSTAQYLPGVIRAVSIFYGDASKKQDRIGAVAFRDKKAYILNQPTANLQVVLGNLSRLKPGGHTPLADGLLKAFDILRLEKRRNSEIIAFAVLVSDCHPEPLEPDMNDIFLSTAYQNTLQVARHYAKARIPIIVINPMHILLKKGEPVYGAQLGMQIVEITGGSYFGFEKNYKLKSNKEIESEAAKVASALLDARNAFIEQLSSSQLLTLR